MATTMLGIRQAYFPPRTGMPRRKRRSEGGFFLLISDAAFCRSPVRAQQLGPRAQSASDGGFVTAKQFPSPHDAASRITEVLASAEQDATALAAPVLPAPEARTRCARPTV